MTVAATHLLRRMARNNLWANARLYQAVLGLRPGELWAARTSFFPSIGATLNHILEVDLYYVDQLEQAGQGVRIFETWNDIADAPALAEGQRALDERLVAYCDGLADEALDMRLPTDRGERGVFPERVDELLMHLFQHDVHHRGQVHAMLSGTSVPPPQLDEFFLDFDAPLRAGEPGM